MLLFEPQLPIKLGVMTSPRTKIEALFNSGLFGCIRVSISPRPFFWALKLCSTSEEMWMTYVGVEHELGEWLGSCDFVAPKMTTWKPKDQG